MYFNSGRITLPLAREHNTDVAGTIRCEWCECLCAMRSVSGIPHIEHVLNETLSLVHWVQQVSGVVDFRKTKSPLLGTVEYNISHL